MRFSVEDLVFFCDSYSVLLVSLFGFYVKDILTS